MSGQLVAENSTCPIVNKHRRLNSMPSVGFEPTIELPQTYSLDRTTTGINGNCMRHYFITRYTNMYILKLSGF
jgi:hypothetical protein